MMISKKIICLLNLSDKFKTQAVYDTLWSTLVNRIWNESNENVAAFLLGTDSGVIRILPGGRFPKNYDVTKRTWYIPTINTI